MMYLKAQLWAVMTLLVCETVHSIPQMMRRRGEGMLGLPSSPADTNSPLPQDQWFTQLLDHFDPTNNITWQQLYQTVEDYHVPGGPVFLMVGGEGAASGGWLVYGSWVDYARQYNALLFQLEHRYYGKSRPTSDVSTENLRYLSSEQALADTAYFIQSMNTLYNLPEGTRWILFGGSYSGNLVAWMRAKYPHLVHGAMSASGPVLAKVDFHEYMNVVKHSLATYGKGCTRAAETANYRLSQLIQHDTGRKIIEKIFRLCDPIDITMKNDVYTLFESLADNLAGVVQYNKDNRFLPSSMDITIDTVCDIMVNESLGNPVVRYAAVNSLLMDVYKFDCVGYKYQDLIEELQETSWDSVAGSYGERQWLYQTCTEFGYYQTSEKKIPFFRKGLYPLQYFLQQCYDVFGDHFTKDTIYGGARRTNMEYGGKHLTATRVVYVHGTIDPWHALGITRTPVPESPAILIKGTAHCANMYPPADTDLPALTAARKEVGDLIGQWLQEY